MTYFKQLSSKHTSPENAYREYVLSQSLKRLSVLNKSAPKDILETMKLQENLNQYIENLIVGESADFKTIFNIDDIADFYHKNLSNLDFIGLDRSLCIELITNSYQMNLDTAAKTMSWESLEKLMIEQKNNTPTIDSSEAKIKLEKIVEDYNLSSVTFASCRITEDSLLNLEERLIQLKTIIGCDNKQLGANKFNLFLDTEQATSIGYSTEFNDNQKLYLNERLAGDVFAHEWLHSLDNMIAKDKGLNISYASEALNPINSIKTVLDEIKKLNPDTLIKMKETLKEDTLRHMLNIVDRFDSIGIINNVNEFKDFIKSQFNKNLKSEFNRGDRDNFLEGVKKYQKEKSACSSYLLSEIDLLNNLKYVGVNNSVFYEHAKIMDENLNKTKYLIGKYSVTPVELLARSFEGFVGLKLNELNMPNLIATASDQNSFIQSQAEVKNYKDKWELLMLDVREMLTKIVPLEKVQDKIKENTAKSLTVLDVLGNIEKMKKNSIIKSETKVKLGS